MNTSDVSQNLASGGGLLPICTLLMIAGSGNESWARIGINTITAVVCLLVCSALIRLVLDRDVGHRWLHGYMLLAFTAIAGGHIWAAWKWYAHPNSHLPLWASVLQNSSLILFSLYFYVTRDDLQITYRRSEEQRRANLHRIEQARRAAVLLHYRVANERGQ